eukprot:gnl/TRDRNA2_/TRDRNA2_119947_c2_seq1.p1 gnl/TRDRNA2_/TRDRNA2_119947_c2~~gnl/TRDRNA2_/TRDRNA2_119947_c2_seq1.p1  ORF type:complete len:501 (+),score=77.65 gnl/TRDRNA2_/TRDRNA2_119947_c2_seq1:3-1505(+)
MLSRASEIVGRHKSDIIELTNEACNKYRLIADYAQRPQMNDLFYYKADQYRKSSIPEKSIILTNNYFPTWLGPIFVGIFIASNAQRVIDKDLRLGGFLAAIHSFVQISVECSHLYSKIMEANTTIEALRRITVFLNMQTDLFDWKKVNRERRKETYLAREALFRHNGGNNSGQQPVAFKSDLIPIQLKNMCFAYKPHLENIMQDVSLTVRQGTMVAVVGTHKAGRSTFLRLLGHTIFPTSGSIYVPSHLRILHVSQEPIMLNLSPWLNLIFGLPDKANIDTARISGLIASLDMHQTRTLVAQWLTEPKTEVNADMNSLQKAEPLKVGSINGMDRSMSSNGTKSTTLENGGPIPEEEEEAEDEDGHNTQRTDEDDEDVDDEEEAFHKHISEFSIWQEELTYTEKVKLHLARALIMNPEVAVLQRPLHHYDRDTGAKVLQAIHTHVSNRGVGLPREDAHRRRPRTCFYSPENIDQAKRADVIWQMNPSTKRVSVVTWELLEK